MSHSVRFGVGACALVLVMSSSAHRAAPAPGDGVPRGKTTLISLDSNGIQGNGAGRVYGQSADGTRVIFTSQADNLVPGDTNGQADMFLRDTTTATTIRVNVTSAGVEGAGFTSDGAISANGRHVMLSTPSQLASGDLNDLGDVYVHDTLTGTTELVSVTSLGLSGNESSGAPEISGNGRYAVWASRASDFVANDRNGSIDIFLRDLWMGITTRVTTNDRGKEADGSTRDPDISANGRYVCFESDATNLVDRDVNGTRDIFRARVVNGLVTHVDLVSVDDLERQGNGNSYDCRISADGMHVIFRSESTNLVEGDTNAEDDIFVRDFTRNSPSQPATTTRVNVRSSGAQANEWSTQPEISADGRYAVFTSRATNLSRLATNGYFHLYRRDRTRGVTQMIVPHWGESPGDSVTPYVSADGRFVAFTSGAYLILSDRFQGDDAFQRDVGREPQDR